MALFVDEGSGISPPRDHPRPHFPPSGLARREGVESACAGHSPMDRPAPTGGSRGTKTDTWSTTQAWCFPLKEAAWKAVAPMQKARTNHASAALNGEIYAIGGEARSPPLHPTPSRLARTAMPPQRLHLTQGTPSQDVAPS